jgi:amino acid transporter
VTSEGVERRAAGYATRTGNDHPNTGHPGNGQEGHAGKRLGPFLCWAIVFADIGTSVYYVPGILYGQVGHLAGLFVTLTLLVFLLLTLKYAEATVRFPEGGGEVTVATRGLSPWAGALGGMFILIDYFLTAAISSLSGLHYFALLVPRLAPYVLLITVLVVVGLGVLNWWGIQESAMVSAVIASIAFVSDLVIVLMVLLHVPLSEIVSIFGEIFSGGHITGLTVLTGFAGAFLAFSGLESIAQLAPVMRVPRRKVVGAALGVVVLTVGISGPLLTIFSTVLLTDPRFHSTMTSPGYAVQAEPTQFISLLAGAYGGTVLAVATAITASALLIFASNTAIIGAYHVMLALARLRYFPRLVTRTDAFRRTPYFAIALVTAIPIIVLLAVRGNIDLLGELYGFGLLGAFSLMCISMDVIRWRERRGERYIGAEVDPELRWVMPASTLPSAGQPPSASLHSAQQPTRTQQTPGPVKHNGRYQYARHDGHHVPTGHLSHWESDGPQAGEQPTSPIQGAARAVAMGATWWSLVATARRSARRIVTAMAARRAAVGERLRSALLPLQTPIQAVWPQITYYLGFLAHESGRQAARHHVRRWSDATGPGSGGAALPLSGGALSSGLPRHTYAASSRALGRALSRHRAQQSRDQGYHAPSQGISAGVSLPRAALTPSPAAHLRDSRSLCPGRGRPTDAVAC